MRKDTAEAKIEFRSVEKQELAKVPTVKLGAGSNIASSASATAKGYAFEVCAFVIHSTQSSPKSSCNVKCHLI